MSIQILQATLEWVNAWMFGEPAGNRKECDDEKDHVDVSAFSKWAMKAKLAKLSTENPDS